MKTPEKQSFCGAFKEYQVETLARNELKEPKDKIRFFTLDLTLPVPIQDEEKKLS